MAAGDDEEVEEVKSGFAAEGNTESVIYTPHPLV